MQLAHFESVCSVEGCSDTFTPSPRRVYPMCRRHAGAAKARAYYARNRAEVRRRAREAYDPDQQAARWATYSEINRAALRERVAAWMRTPEGKASQARYHARNREKRLVANKEWREANRDRRREVWKVYGATRKARKRDAKGSCSREQFGARWQVYGGKCWMCGAEADSIDHVIPLARGGTNWPANLRPACRTCNSAKGARPWRQYAPRKEAA